LARWWRPSSMKSRSMMLTSRSISSQMFAPLACLAAFALSGCYYERSDCENDGNCGSTTYNPPPVDEVAASKIDTGATISDIQAGQGAGVFVEYQPSGKWHLFATCDSTQSKYRCTWDVIVSTRSAA